MKAVSFITAALLISFSVTTASAQEASVSADTTTTETAAAPTLQADVITPPPAAPVAASNAPVAQFPKEVTDAVGTPEPGKALVVFFRPKKFVGAAIGFKVREKDVELGKLRNGNFFAIQVTPGVHEYVVHSETKDVTKIEAEDGETYFLMGELNMGVLAGRPNLTPSTGVNFQSELNKLKPSKALK
jgi:hypothetical protein